jgi:hypothetical protein
MGVGIFSKNLDSDYTNKVLEMLADRELAFIIADESFCYGANYSISNVIITDELADLHSINTILQLIGRTSRVGKSWSGKVYLDTNTSARIINFFSNPSLNCVEGSNINIYFERIKQKYLDENEAKQEQQEQQEHVAELDNSQKLSQTQIISNDIISDTAENKFDGWVRGSEFKIITKPIVEIEPEINTNSNDWSRGSEFKKSIVTNNLFPERKETNTKMMEQKQVQPELNNGWSRGSKCARNTDIKIKNNSNTNKKLSEYDKINEMELFKNPSRTQKK